VFYQLLPIIIIIYYHKYKKYKNILIEFIKNKNDKGARLAFN
jgi:hypothetical protein